MRLWLIAVSVLVLLSAAVPITAETYSFKLPPQPHTRLINGVPAFSYGTTWEIEIPAPSQRPLSVDLWNLSTYIYKYIAFNPGSAELAGGFKNISFKTEFVLEGVLLGTVTRELNDLGFVLHPGDFYWGPGRPKVTKKVRGSVTGEGQWPDPGGARTWTLTVKAVSHFSIYSSGPLWFGQSLRQRVKGKVRYLF